jgi:hypothetical protein
MEFASQDIMMGVVILRMTIKMLANRLELRYGNEINFCVDLVSVNCTHLQSFLVLFTARLEAKEENMQDCHLSLHLCRELNNCRKYKGGTKQLNIAVQSFPLTSSNSHL